MAKKWIQKLKYLQNEESFEIEKVFFIIFNGPSLKQIKYFFGKWKFDFKYVFYKFSKCRWLSTELTSGPKW